MTAAQPAAPPPPLPAGGDSRADGIAGGAIPAGGGPAGVGHAAGAELERLLAAMGFDGAQVPPGDREAILSDIGGMVRELAAGLVLLLSARKMVKAEFRMDETQIQPEENNPFKFFKVAELALDELFMTRSGGFQPPAEATRTAFDDLQQHMMLTVSAMQRAFGLLFERLSPDAIDRDDDDSGIRIRGLGNRKGKWESYVEVHARMRANLDAVTRQIMAEAFAQVQEEQARKTAKEYWEKKQ